MDDDCVHIYDEVELPSNCYDIYEMYRKDNGSFLSICNYINKALEYGRPIDSTMIVMVGDSGSGKSTTINALFNDPNLCQANKFRSQTKTVTVIRKRLCVTSVSPAIVGYLSLVDTPGSFDSEGEDARNFAIIKNFRNENPALASICRDIDKNCVKRMLKGVSLKVKTPVYPNIVLFFMAAMSGRIDGTHTSFRNSLQTLKKANLVDLENPNLIVVVTHAIRLGREPEEFSKTVEEMEDIIRSTVYKIFQLEDLHIVYVENKAESEYLNKDYNSDYYVLPNGDLSHYNLLEAIRQRFDTRDGFEDLLGKLFVGWYSNPNCKEKQHEAEIHALEYDPNAGEIGEAMMELEQLHVKPEAGVEPLATKFACAYLGYGFCPKRGELRPTNLLSGNPFQKVQIGSKEFQIPGGVTVIPDTNTSIYTLNYDEVIRSSTSWDNAANCNFPLPWFNQLNFGLDLARWRSNSQRSSETTMVCFVLEKRLALLRIDEPKSILGCGTFRNHFENLPKSSSEDNEMVCENFFDRWGTHFVIEQGVGGAIYVNYLVNKSNLDENYLRGIEAKFKLLFGNILDSGFNVENKVEELRNLGVQNERINIIGGSAHPTITKFEDLSSEIIAEWNTTIEEAPANLIGNSQSFPYSLLLESGPKLRILREGTSNYLQSRTISQVEERTQQAVSTRMMNEAIQANQTQSSNCFPKGTPVYVCGGGDAPFSNYITKPIETLKDGDVLKTVDIKMPTAIKATGYCTMLHADSLKEVDYLVLSFDNGRELIVSEDHLIFFLNNGRAQTKKANQFIVGDQAVYNYQLERFARTSKCMGISKKICMGAFAPLTHSGTFIANGFFVTSYANVGSFSIAQTSMLPLKAWHTFKPILQFKYLKKIRDCEEREANHSGNTSLYCCSSKADGNDGIHLYAKVMMTIRNAVSHLL